MPYSFTVQAIVLKRRNYQEADRFITLYSRERGKVEAMAKGIRKLKSKKRASLEPGNLVRIHLVKSHHLPIITESQLLHTYPEAKKSLDQITKLHQILEIVDLLTVEEESHPQVFNLLSDTLTVLEHNGSHKTVILENIRLILKDLGFTHDKQFSENGLKRYIEELVGKNLRSKSFLNVSALPSV